MYESIVRGVPALILEKIDENRLLIALSSEDMDILDLNLNRLNFKDEYSKQIVRQLLLKAKNEIGFYFDDDKIVVEVIPQNDGCFVLITLISKKNLGRKIYKVKEDEKVYLFEFKSVDSLLDVIKLLYNKNLFDFKNTAISCQSKYYFIIYSNGSIPINLQSILTEYGRLLSDDYISAARVIELGRVLAKDNAIKLIGEKLSD